jgi:hypothetical protein
MSRRPTATILKLIRGDAHPERHKDDRPKVAAMPSIPPGVVLSAEEQDMFNWLLENVALPGVHGTGDGGSFVKIAKLWVRVCEADRKCAQFGLVMKNPKGKPELQPYARLSRDLWQQLGIAFAEIGATPAGRVKIAGPRNPGAPGEATSWDEIS